MTKSDSGSFWKRLGAFVRNPTRDWALTDEQALQEHEKRVRTKAIEDQKRQNDFIRKRELDGLRKLRKREASDLGIDDSLQTNVPELSSQPIPVHDRDATLRKIDEIEKSMSGDTTAARPRSRPAPATNPPRAQPQSTAASPSTASPSSPPSTADTRSDAVQWKVDTAYADTTLMSKPGAPAAPTGAGAPRATAARTASGVPTTQPPLDAPTLPLESSLARVGAAPQALDEQPTLAAPTQLSADRAPTRAAAKSGDSWLRASSDFMPSAFFAVEVHEALSSNPLFDQAVMDFANGDFAAAEAALREAISNTQDLGAEKELWLALFDLYRASGQLDKFEALVVDFVSRFQTSAPMTDDGLPATAAAPKPASAGFKPSIHFSANVDVAQAERLRKLLRNAPAAVELNFAAVRSIDPAALPVLIDAVKTLNQTACTVTLEGIDALLALCQAQAPAMQRDADTQWWALRLESLRLLNQQDDFDAVALDYCVTYEISPPSWEPSRARIDRAGSEAADTAADASTTRSGFHKSGLHSVLGSGGTRSAQLHLSGEIVGDSGAFLAPLDREAKTHDQLSISLRQLRRIDFSSAGALLNWAMAQHNAGKTLQFTGVHRLIAGLFSILGLHEHALIQLRRD
jgi:ABC-type transporter Mla MlaB component